MREYDDETGTVHNTPKPFTKLELGLIACGGAIGLVFIIQTIARIFG